MKGCWLSGKTAVITGGASGIGAGLTHTLITKYGCRVIAIALNDIGVSEMVASLGSFAKNFTCLYYDVSKKESWVAIKKYLEENGLQADIIINNAGILPPFDRYEHTSVEKLEECMNVDFYAAAYSILEMYPHVKNSPTPAFVTVSSSAALAPLVGTAVYSAAKSASKALTECFAFEHPEMYVAYVCPGFTKTNLFVRQNEDMGKNKLISAFMSKRDKMVKKIVRGIKRKRRRLIFGADAKIMLFMYKHFPRSSPKLFRFVMRRSKQKVFENIFKQ